MLAEDRALVGAAFRPLLGAAPDIEAARGQAGIDLALAAGADVALMDLRMPGLDGIGASRRIGAHPALAGLRVVIGTAFDADEYVFETLRARASGFLVNDAEPEDLIHAVRMVARGDALLSRSLTRRLIAKTHGSRPMAKLDPRDRAELVAVADETGPAGPASTTG